jgi:hypothetical protein
MAACAQLEFPVCCTGACPPWVDSIATGVASEEVDICGVGPGPEQALSKRAMMPMVVQKILGILIFNQTSMCVILPMSI